LHEASRSTRPSLDNGQDDGAEVEKITAKQEPRASMTKRKPERLLDLFGRFDWRRDYDYKRERTRGNLF